MNSIALCEQCGQEYGPDILRGLCPVCLFAHALPEGESVPAMPQTDDLSQVRFVSPKINDLAPHFAQLDIRELTGQGGMSAVYRAHHTHLDRTVALKVLPKEIADTQGGEERFQREAQTLAQLSHTNIVNLYDAGQAGPWCYIVMEFVPGPNLRQLMGESKLAAADVLRIVSGICDGLQYAHDQGVVHRDIKPENVLLDSAGHVKLVDFGLAKLLHPPPSRDVVTRTHQVMGTPYYLAPEQVETPASVDQRADLYSLGVMMYEMLTGELPLGYFEPPSQRIGSDPALDAVVLQAMSKDPQRRYQQARDLQRSMTSPATMKPNALVSKSPPSWRIAVNELLLLAFLILAAYIGCLLLVGGGLASESISDAAPPSREISGDLAKHIAMSLPAFFISFLFARVNVSSANHWHDLSPIQTLCVPILVTSYVVFGTLLLIVPGLFILLFGSLPLLADLETWSAFGKSFVETDRTSMLTSYWLRVYGVGALTAASWGVLLVFVLRQCAASLRKLFHPVDDTTGFAIARTAAYCAVGVLAPCGLALLYASAF